MGKSYLFLENYKYFFGDNMANLKTRSEIGANYNKTHSEIGAKYIYNSKALWHKCCCRMMIMLVKYILEEK